MKCYNIYHWTPKVHKGLLLLPIGMYYNIDLQQARAGDYIKFQDDDKRYMIKRIAYMDMKTQIANLLSMFLYNCPILVSLKMWQSTAVLEGNKKNAVSRNKCLVMHYNTIPEKDEAITSEI